MNLFTRTDTRAEVLEGDCLSVLKTMEDESVEAVVTDPPAGISFMNASWDSNKGSRNHWIAWLTEVMEEVLRVTKPGGHALVWALPRTSHWTAMALEDAGWEVRDRVTHHFGSGFPKSANISKQIDKMAGAERPTNGHSRPEIRVAYGKGAGALRCDLCGNARNGTSCNCPTSPPATDAARQWDGYGTALKPSTEDWWLCRKPLSESSIARNVLEHGTGGLNIDGCRVGTETISQHGRSKDDFGFASPEPAGRSWSGRFPANLLLSHSADCVRVGEKRVKGSRIEKPCEYNGAPGYFGNGGHRPARGHGDPDGKETVTAYECADGCPCKALDEQSGVSKSPKPYEFNGTKNSAMFGNAASGVGHEKEFGDSGGASRFFAQFHEPDTGAGFFYCPKSSRAERNKGLEGMPEKRVAGHNKWTDVDYRKGNGEVTNRGHANNHPTVKSVKLMRYLVRLVTPPGGTCLDPFAGSGSTGVAAVHEGFDFVGIEMSEEYAEIAKRRIAHALENPE